MSGRSLLSLSLRRGAEGQCDLPEDMWLVLMGSGCPSPSGFIEKWINPTRIDSVPRRGTEQHRFFLTIILAN